MISIISILKNKKRRRRKAWVD